MLNTPYRLAPLHRAPSLGAPTPSLPAPNHPDQEGAFEIFIFQGVGVALQVSAARLGARDLIKMNNTSPKV